MSGESEASFPRRHPALRVPKKESTRPSESKVCGIRSGGIRRSGKGMVRSRQANFSKERSFEKVSHCQAGRLEGRISLSIRRHIAKRSTGLAKDALVSPSCSPASGKKKNRSQAGRSGSIDFPAGVCERGSRSTRERSALTLNFAERKKQCPRFRPACWPLKQFYALKLFSGTVRRRQSWGFWSFRVRHSG